MKVWGLTGGIASGKSHVLRELKDLGAQVIDTDQVAREVVDPTSFVGKKTLGVLAQKFGPEVVNPNLQLNREKLREMISSDATIQKELEFIMHPVILTEVENFVQKCREEGSRLVVIEGTRLIESGFHKKLDGLIYVDSPEPVRVKRLMQRDQVPLSAAQRLMSIQNLESMKKNATHVIANDGSFDHLHEQCLKFYKEKIS